MNEPKRKWGKITPTSVVLNAWTMLAVICRFVVNRYMKPDLVLVGAMATVNWEGSGTVRSGFMSFAPEPTRDDELDVFGISKRETFHWLAGMGELISLIWKQHPHGWTVRDATLIYASVIE